MGRALILRDDRDALAHLLNALRAQKICECKKPFYQEVVPRLRDMQSKPP